MLHDKSVANVKPCTKEQDATIPIPQPPKRPLTGNLYLLNPENGLGSLVQVAKEYGPIVKMALGPTLELVFVSSQELTNELCDETRFRKVVGGGLLEARTFAGDGLFTAHTYPENLAEPNWWKAHRILMPAFGTISMQAMIPDMIDIRKFHGLSAGTNVLVDQMLVKWERTGSKEAFDVVDSMTVSKLILHNLTCLREWLWIQLHSVPLTTDSTTFIVVICILLFKRLYLLHYAVLTCQMENLVQVQLRARRHKVLKPLYLHQNSEFEKNNEYIFGIADEIIKERKRAGPEGRKNDLLQKLLDGRDPVTKEGLDDKNIRFNLVTFLIAG